MNSNYDVLYKFLLVGDSGVGKSNILSRYVNGEFDLNTKSTLGVEFSTRTVTSSDFVARIQIWDTAGQERYRAITTAYYRGAHCVMLVYDITKKSTFDNIGKWLKEVNDKCADNPKLVLIGNMCDLSHSREVSFDEGKNFAEENNLFFLELSALNGTNVDLAFDIMINEIYASKLDKQMNNNNNNNNNNSFVVKMRSFMFDYQHENTQSCCQIF